MAGLAMPGKKAKKFGSAAARGWITGFPAIEADQTFFMGVTFYAAVKAYQSFERGSCVEERFGREEHGREEHGREEHSRKEHGPEKHSP